MTAPAQPPWERGAYSIKRHGVTITNCDAEPVQTPGCTQDWGVLLVLRPADFTILQVSDNCAQWLGHPPEQILGRSAAEILGPSVETRLREVMERDAVERNPIYALTIPAPPGSTPGGEAVQLDLSAHTVDGVMIVELDIGLPSMDGYEVARRFRADPGLSSAVLVALTGWGSDGDRQLTRTGGFDHHLTKPADPSAVEMLLSRIASETVR